MTDMEARRIMLRDTIHNRIESDDMSQEKERLAGIHGPGNVWTTQEATQDFTFIAFAAPFAVVARKSDGVKGTLSFQHRPRLYFDFQETSDVD